MNLLSVPCLPHHCVLVLSLALGSVATAEVRFNRDIRPILSENCFACHGPDEKHNKAGLRLDTREGATALNSEGKRALSPGSVSDSEMIRRILSQDPDDVMPPPESDKRLQSGDIELIKQWVNEGAAFEGH